MYGEDVVSLDGQYGPRTVAAVARFLRENSLPEEGDCHELSPQAAAMLRQSYLSQVTDVTDVMGLCL